MSVKCYSFTLNNYTEEETNRIKSNLNVLCKYYCLGFEVSESGTPHIQGCCVFLKRCTFLYAKEQISVRCHLEKTKDVKCSSEYCKKDGNFFEFGSLVAETPLELFKNDVKNGIRCIKTLRENHSMVFARYNRFALDYLNDNQIKIEKPSFPLREWQADLNIQLKRPPDDRTITFVVDFIGNTGKSWFAHYFADLHEHVQIMSPGKRADLSFTLLCTTRYLFMDCPRAKQQEFIPYDFLEDVKNGYVFCSKYESCYKRLNTMHVVVLMNEMPDMTKLSKDRYNIINL